MRLLILNWRDLKHPKAGGSEVYAQNLARHWALWGHEVLFFCASSRGLPAREEQDGYTIIRRGGAIGVYREARRYFERECTPRPDVVLDVVNTVPFMTPRWATGTKSVALIHQVARDVWPYEVRWPLSLVGRYVLEPRWLAAYAEAPVLTISRSSKESLGEYGLRNISVVHAGVDPVLDRCLPPKMSSPTLIFVGRLSSNKRPDHALQAHALLRRSMPDAQLWVVGDGPMADRLRRESRVGVRFFGRVDPAHKQDLMASAHALVSTSVREGWGLTISEAARLGTRTIAYDVAGLRDSVPAAGGVLVDPTPTALATALAERLPEWQREDRPDLGSAGVVSWDTVADEVLTEVRRLTGQ